MNPSALRYALDFWVNFYITIEVMTINDTQLLIRCVALREGDQWVAVCLPYSLCAQASTLKEAKNKLHDQIHEYLYDALCGQDRKHASYLLARKAPMKYWAIYFLARVLGQIKIKSHARIFKEYMPVAPMAC